MNMKTKSEIHFLHIFGQICQKNTGNGSAASMQSTKGAFQNLPLMDTREETAIN